MNNDAESLKQKGNKCFKEGNIDAAINNYTKAIEKDPGKHTYWQNRALCHIKNEDWELVEQDCRRALSLDWTSVKAHFLWGKALVQLGQYEEALKKLTEALSLSKSQNNLFEEDIRSWLDERQRRLDKQFANHKLKEYEVEAKERDQILQYIKDTIRRESKKRGARKHAFHSSSSNTSMDVDDDNSNALSSVDIVPDDCETLIEKIGKIFSRADEKSTGIPEDFQCPISWTLMRDPVITPTGVSYEKKELEQWLKTHSGLEPYSSYVKHWFCYF
eukprot:GHVL01008847.1.p1 GENE.GHVL01008847.1~~GHVL01008847.1.p1  ORF type:complete len:274 (+),score=56.31 GHVL01008847.1:47-868(+)